MRKRRLFPVEKFREDLIDIEAKTEHPSKIEDYEITWDVKGCKKPEEFDFV